MKIVKYGLSVVVILAIVVAFLAPIGPLPGFTIGGTPTPAPASWPDTSQIDEIKLKVANGIPRVVIIWMVEYDSELYVVGAADSGWTTKIGDESPVEVRIEDRTYALDALRVQSNQRPILEAYVAKYQADYPDIVAGFPAIEDTNPGFAVFHLRRK